MHSIFCIKREFQSPSQSKECIATEMNLRLAPHGLVSFARAVGTEHLELGCQVAVGTTEGAVGVTKAFHRTLRVTQLLLQLKHLIQARWCQSETELKII